MHVPISSFISVIFFATQAVAGPSQVIAHYADNGGQGMSELLAANSAGNLFVVSTVTELWGSPQIRVVKMDPQGNTLATFDFGGRAFDIPTAASADTQSNVVIVGTTSSFDFPLVSPLISIAHLPAAFVTKIDARLDHIIFSTLLGGASAPGTSGHALALDSAGNIYVSGGTPGPRGDRARDGLLLNFLERDFRLGATCIHQRVGLFRPSESAPYRRRR